MRLLHASAMKTPWQLKQRFHFSCLTKVHIQKWSLPDSNANHTNVTKHLKWRVSKYLVGAIQAQSFFLNGIKFSSKTAFLPCTYGDKEKKYIHSFFSPKLSPSSNWAHVCLGWEGEWVLQSLCSLQTDNGIGHITINMQRYCQNISLHGLWFRIGWLESDRNRKSYVYSGLLHAVF